MVASRAREDADVRAGVERWLNDHGVVVPNTHEIVDGPFSVGPISRPTTGLSSDTVFVTAIEADGGAHDLVVRLAPAGDGLFPEYDLGAQVRMQNTVHGLGIPTAAPARYEADRSWLGDPFMVMPRVAGRVVDTRPAYTRVGWLAESEPALQEAVLDDVLGTLAALHREDASVIDGAVVPIAETFADACKYLDWAGDGGAVPEFMIEARTWCDENLPSSPAPDSILWGDAQLANCVFTDAGAVAALLDFELAGAGPAEIDLGWFIALHEMTAVRSGVELPGFGDRRSMIATYESALGRSVEAMAWYEMFALLRSGSIMVRMARLLAGQGVDETWLYRNNPTEAAVARVRARA